MKTIEEIQSAMQAVMDAADAENRSLTDAEVTTYEGLEADLKSVNKTAELRARQDAYRAPITGFPAVIHSTGKGDEVLERAFESYLRTGQKNMDIVELRNQGTGSDTAGGYVVPTGFRNKLIEVRSGSGGIASVAENMTTATGATLEWPTIDDTANSGVVTAEGSEAGTGADLVFGTVSLGAFKYATNGSGNNALKVPVELLQDAAFDVTSLISRKLGQRLSRAMASDWAVGDGSGEPQGLFRPAPTVLISGSIDYDGLIDLVHSVDTEYREGAVFVMADATLKTLRKLTDSGSGRPLWLPQAEAGMTTLPGGTLLGYPVIIDNAAPSAQFDPAAAAGDGVIAFGRIDEAYIIRHVADVSVLVNPYTSGAAGLVEYSAWARADGAVQNTAAYKLLAFDEA